MIRHLIRISMKHIKTFPLILLLILVKIFDKFLKEHGKVINVTMSEMHVQKNKFSKLISGTKHYAYISNMSKIHHPCKVQVHITCIFS